MNQRKRWVLVLLLSGSTLASGCMHARQYYFFDDKNLAGYKCAATELEAPNVESCPLDEVRQAQRPMTLENFEHAQFWDLCLQDAVQTTLANSKVIRRIQVAGAIKGTAVAVPTIDSEGGAGSLLLSPDNVKTTFDPAVQESTVNALTQGVEAALSDFDAQLSASMFWERDERPINGVTTNEGFVGGTVGGNPNFEQDVGVFRSQISKIAANGTRFAVRHNVFYDRNNIAGRDSSDQFFLNYEFEARQPLLHRAGTLFNRIAGPNSSIGVYNGVAIARINNDITLADFECNVRNMVFDVEKAYWELHFAYRALDAAKRGRDAAVDYYRRVSAADKMGKPLYPAEVIAGARADYFRFRSQVELILSDLLQTERALRYAMGLTATDCRLIRPCDEPTTAAMCFDWDQIHCEALCRSCELRQQKWRIKQKELELIASRNYLLPKLDAVALYRFLGAGDDLIDPNGRGVFPFEGSNAYSTLTDGKYQEWQIGLEFNMAIGFRKELSEVRNKQLQLARERSRLQDQELTVTHLLSDALRLLEDWHHVMESQLNAWIAAKQRTAALRAKLESGEQVNFLDFREAIGSEANAETEYYRALINYNKEIPDVHFRKGSLLEYNNVCLAEGPWPGKAYCDAQRHANARAHGVPLNYGITRPDAFSRGPIMQHQGTVGEACGDGMPYGEPTLIEGGTLPEPSGDTETVPAPKSGFGPPPVPGKTSIQPIPMQQPPPQPPKENTARRYQSPDGVESDASQLPSRRSSVRF